MLLFFSIYAFLIALLVGSFLNVIIARMPEDQSVISPPSHCPACGNNIRPYDNIPVLSWLILGGKCRDCNTSISFVYPAIELFTGCLGYLVFAHYIQDLSDLTWANAAGVTYMFSFVAILIAVTYIDIRHYIIPDQLSIYTTPFAIVAMAGLDYLGFEGAISVKESIIGSVFGGGVLGGVALLWWLIRGIEGMGMGDVKLLLLIGAVLGPWPAIPFVLFVSAMLAVGFMLPIQLLQGGGMSKALPYGPFLAWASILYILHGHEIMSLWLPGYEAVFLQI